MPQVGELLLMERYAAYCDTLAENCKLSRTARLLRLLAADVTLERDRYYRLLMAQQPADISQPAVPWSWEEPAVQQPLPKTGNQLASIDRLLRFLAVGVATMWLAVGIWLTATRLFQ